MQFDWSTLALQTVNFAILAWLLHRFLYKPVLRLIDARRAEIDHEMAAAAAAKDDATAKTAQIEQQRAGMAKAREAALAAAAAQATALAETKRAETEQELATLRDKARKTIAEEREQAEREIRAAALDLGVGIARRLLDEIPAGLRAEAWLEQVEGHLATMTPAARAELRTPSGADATLRIVSATSLPDSARAAWGTRLTKALGDGLVLEFAVDPGLVAGVELHFPAAILRFSWRSALASMRAEIEADGKPV